MKINYAKTLEALQAELSNGMKVLSQMEKLILQKAIIFCSRLGKDPDNDDMFDSDTFDYNINESTHTALFFIDQYEVLIISIRVLFFSA